MDREGSAAHNLDAIVQGIVHNNANTEYYGFCTDDKHIEDIRSEVISVIIFEIY